MSDDTDYVRTLVRLATKRVTPVTINRIYRISDTIRIPSNEGLEIVGTHLYRTGFIWEGPAGVPIFDRPNSRDNLVRNLSIIVESPAAVAFVDSNLNYPTKDPRHSPVMTIPSNNRHERLRIVGNDLLAVYRHYLVDKSDENNEAHVDVDVHISGANCGWMIDGQQSKYHVMQRCRFNGGRYSLNAIDCYGGSFSWLDGGGYGAIDSFFRIRDQTDTIAIHRADVDGSGRFLHVSGPNGKTGAAQPVDILGGRFMTHKMDPLDLRAILCETAGPLTVQSFQLGSGTQPIARIAMTGFRGQVSVTDVMFGSYGSTRANSLDLRAATLAIDTGNTYHRADGESYVG